VETPIPTSRESRWILRAILILVPLFALLRLAHWNLLWADEDYHVAAAVNILHGKVPYRDFWYDKPPLNAVFYLLIGGHAGVALRLLDAGYVLLACYLAYRLASSWWSQKEGYAAAFLLAFFTTFYLPSAVIPFAADALMIVPHLAAIYYARKRRPVWAGLFAGIGFLFNTKALFVLAACGVFLLSLSQLLRLLVGFALPVLAGLGWAAVSGAWPGYCEQVWRWGLLYARNSPVAHPIQTGVSRTANWLGFHAALAAATAVCLVKTEIRGRIKLSAWIVLSFIAVCLGTRFAPHYFLQLLPPLVIAASRGIVLALEMRRKLAGAVFSALLLVPLIRFSPHYVTLTFNTAIHRQPRWSDVVMDLDSQRAAAQVLDLARPGDTLFVWGYRPDLYVYTHMSSDSRFWDSQPLTGVPADRHLSATNAIYGGPAAASREQLARSHPTFIVDGLSLLNPRLSPQVYPELRDWLRHYRLVARTNLSLIYRRAE
jgi:4-amino-4-deoxy-L-arabinose transferase-like glycosyltransferase